MSLPLELHQYLSVRYKKQLVRCIIKTRKFCFVTISRNPSFISLERATSKSPYHFYTTDFDTLTSSLKKEMSSYLVSEFNSSVVSNIFTKRFLSVDLYIKINFLYFWNDCIKSLTLGIQNENSLHA